RALSEEQPGVQRTLSSLSQGQRPRGSTTRTRAFDSIEQTRLGSPLSLGAYTSDNSWSQPSAGRPPGMTPLWPPKLGQCSAHIPVQSSCWQRPPPSVPGPALPLPRQSCTSLRGITRCRLSAVSCSQALLQHSSKPRWLQTGSVKRLPHTRRFSE